MEQKRTLWIIAAVGVFLLVVLGAAMILYSSAASSRQPVASYKIEKPASESGWISLAPPESKPQGEKEATGLLPAQHESAISGDENPLQAQENALSSEKTKPSIGENGIARVGELTVYADKVTLNSKDDAETNRLSSESPVTVINNTTIDLTDIPVREKTQESKSVKPVVKAGKKAEPKSPSKTKPAATTKNASAPEKTEYWIQVTSLTSRKNADTAREVLDENKIPADVFTYTDSKNRLFYRVRVGPYTTKSEAEYWKTRIAKIENFKNSQSYVAATTVTQ